MATITNPKIEKQRAAIARTKASIADCQAKLREQEKHLRALEDIEIVAQYRREVFSDARLETVRAETKNEPALETAGAKEEESDGITETI